MRLCMRLLIMVIQHTDYDKPAILTAAIESYLSGQDTTVYLNRVQYALDRDCDREDFFLNTLSHQVKNGFQDKVEDPGFELYNVVVTNLFPANTFRTVTVLSPASGDTGAVIGDLIENENLVVAQANLLTPSATVNIPLTAASGVNLSNSNASVILREVSSSNSVTLQAAGNPIQSSYAFRLDQLSDASPAADLQLLITVAG